MSSAASLPNILLPPDLATFVQSQVKSGQFESEAEVVQAALYLLQDKSLDREERLERLRAEIKVGLDQLDRGEGEPWNKEEVWSEVQRRLNDRQANS